MTRHAHFWSVLIATCALLATACSATATLTGVNGEETSADSAAARSTDGNQETFDFSGEPQFELRGELPLSTNEVNALISFIERDAGRPFLRPPVIVAQSPQDFVDGLAEDIAEFQADAEITVRSLQSLGLTTDGVGEVANAFGDLLSSPDGIQGYYDPEFDELYVPVGALGDDDFRSLLVHELTHALDGQYVDLNVLQTLVEEAEVTGDWEPVVALQAVAEGRATSVQNRWMRDNGVSAAVPSDPESLDSVPPAMILSLSIPYAFGEQFVEGNGGAAGTWDLLETPPPSSEDFMVFGGIEPGQEIVDVPTPDAAGPVLDEAVYGAADMFIWLLGESLEPDPELLFPTFTAIDGWAGGRAVLWGDDTQSCTRIALAGDSDQELAEIREAVDVWVQSGPDRSVEADGDLTVVTSCAPYVP